MSLDPEDLWREASLLHHAAFARDVPEGVARRYVEAHQTASWRVDAAQSTWMKRILEEGADLEALELVLRGRRPDHLLCRKFKLLVYVAEAFPESYDDFVNEDPRRARALLSLAVHGLRTLGKHVRGRWLLRKIP